MILEIPANLSLDCISVSERMSKEGKKYYVLYFYDDHGEPANCFIPEADALPLLHKQIFSVLADLRITDYGHGRNFSFYNLREF